MIDFVSEQSELYKIITEHISHRYGVCGNRKVNTCTMPYGNKIIVRLLMCSVVAKHTRRNGSLFCSKLFKQWQCRAASSTRRRIDWRGLADVKRNRDAVGYPAVSSSDAADAEGIVCRRGHRGAALLQTDLGSRRVTIRTGERGRGKRSGHTRKGKSFGDASLHEGKILAV